MKTTVTHFTAWLVNDTSALDQGCMDITILEDTVVGYTEAPGAEEPVWGTDATKDIAFYAVTTVDAADGDTKDGIDEASELMEQAGWRIVGDWDAVDNAYIVTVERA
jgi:hypothetical protein